MDFRILGPLEVVVGSTTVDLGPPKQRALLAALLLHPNEIVSSDQLIDWLWAGDAPRTANHSVQIYVSELRKLLADDSAPVIETRPPGYFLRAEPAMIDAGRFESMFKQAESSLQAGDASNGLKLLQAALALWRGRPLSDFAYDEFAQPHIRRLESMWELAAEKLASILLELDQVSSALPLLGRLVEHNPLAEGPRRLQMLALYRAGRQVDALRSYRRFRSLVGDELGLEPSPELQRLEEQILLRDEILGAPSSAGSEPSSRPGDNAHNPYKGLRAFEEADADDFFGREAMTSELVERLEEGARLVAVVGPSGSGKSSLVRAGLIPRLRRGALPRSDRWPIVTMMPGRHPFEELEAALCRVADTTGIDLGATDTGLLRTALRILSDEGRELILIIDQFEELFTLVDERTRRSFLNSLVATVDSPHSRVRVIVTLRADFYDRPLVYPAFAPLFVAGAMTITPLEAAELEAVVREPAARVGVSIESPLLAQIVSDMSEHPGALPLLQYTLTELFDIRSGSELRVAEYQRIGGLRGTLSRRAEEMLSAMRDREQELARQLFLRLVRVDKGGQSTRRRVPLAELRSMGSDDGSADEIIARLGAERLLMFDRDLATAEATVEVTHEAILTEWTRLRDWIDEHRSDLQRRESLGSAAADWEAAARHEDYLLSGTRLASFETWRQETTLQLARHEAAYLQASSDQRQAVAFEESRRRRRARRLRMAQLAAVGSVAAALAFFAPQTIDSVLNPPPAVAFVIDQADAVSIGLGQMGLTSFEQALVEFDVDGETRVWNPRSGERVEDVHAELARQGVDLVISFLGGSFEPAFAIDNPDTRFAMFDVPVDLPNVTSLVFAEHEGSFLMGAAAALTSETGVIGFIGGVDIPVIWRFQMGFEAGARYVRPDVEVRIDYLGQYFETSGFGSPSYAARVAESMYRDGVDVIFTVAGDSGHGTLDAAERLSAELERHLWAIGVDVDEYHTSQRLLDLEWPTGSPPWNVAAWPPHVLTSMLKRYDVAVATVVEEYARGQLEPGVRELGLAEKGVGYATSGGHISELVPVLDDLERRIVSGEIVVPSCPPGREELCLATGTVPRLIGQP